MPDEVAVDDRLTLRRYLLGLLPEDDGDEVEDRFAADPAYFAGYQEVERGLIRDYADGTMTTADAAQFERNYLNTEERRRHVIIVRALMSVQAEHHAAQTARFSPARKLVLAFGLSALVVAGVYWNHRRLIGEEQLRASHQIPSDTSSVLAANHGPDLPAPAPESGHPPSRLGATGPADVRRGILAAPKNRLPKSDFENSPASSRFQATLPPTPQEPPPEITPTIRQIELIPQAELLSPRQTLPGSPTEGTLEQRLTSLYVLTRPTPDNTNIATPGAALILQKRGFSAGAVLSRIETQNIYRDGQLRSGAVSVVRRFGALAGYVPSVGTAAGTTRDFVVGEKLYVTKITVDRDRDRIVFDLISDPYGDAGRFKATLRFDLPKGTLAREDLGQIQAVIAEVLKNAPSDR